MVQGQPVSTTGKPSDQPVGSSHYNGSSNTDSFTHQGRTKCQLISLCAISYLTVMTILRTRGELSTCTATQLLSSRTQT